MIESSVLILDIVETEQNLSLVDGLALADSDGLDRTAVAMLDLLKVLVDLDRSLRDDGACQLGGCRPAPAAHDQANRQDRAEDDVAAQREALSRCCSDRGSTLVEMAIDVERVHDNLCTDA